VAAKRRGEEKGVRRNGRGGGEGRATAKK